MQKRCRRPPLTGSRAYAHFFSIRNFRASSSCLVMPCRAIAVARCKAGTCFILLPSSTLRRSFSTSGSAPTFKNTSDLKLLLGHALQSHRCGKVQGGNVFHFVAEFYLATEFLYFRVSAHFQEHFRSQAPAWSCLAEPSLWQGARRERVSFCCRVLPCDGVSLLPGQRPLSRTLHTHRKWTGFFQS